MRQADLAHEIKQLRCSCGPFPLLLLLDLLRHLSNSVLDKGEGNIGPSASPEKPRRMISGTRAGKVLYLTVSGCGFVMWGTANHRDCGSLAPTCRNLATSSFSASLLRSCSSFFSLSSKVDGSMFGKSLKATGRRNSMNGTTCRPCRG